MQSSKSWFIKWVVRFLFASLAAAADAQYRLSKPIVQPATYIDPTAKFALLVDPIERHGQSGARYRFMQDSVVVWSGEKPYTLHSAEVTPEGLIAGYAYRSVPVADQAPAEYLHIVILDFRGDEVLNEVHERRHSLVESSVEPPPNPYVLRFIVDPGSDTLFVNVSNDRVITPDRPLGPPWWLYRMSTGELLGRKDRPQSKEDRQRLRPLEMKPLQSAPLLLEHSTVWGDGRPGAHFGLIDRDLNEVWSQEFLHDYLKIGLGSETYVNPEEYLREHPAILSVGKQSGFELRCFATEERIHYSVTVGDSGGYIVTETGRKPFVDESATPAAQSSPMKNIDLNYLGDLKLTTVNDSPIRDIVNMTFDQHGMLYFERLEPKGSTSLMQIDASGNTISKRHFRERVGNPSVHWAHVERMLDGRFCMGRARSGNPQQDGTPSQAFLVSLETGEETAAPFTLVSSIGRFEDGGCVVLNATGGASGRHKGVVTERRLTCYNAAGEVCWSFDDFGTREPRFCPPLDMDVTPDERIVLLCAGWYVQILDREGTVLSSINLHAGLDASLDPPERKAPSSLVTDTEGGFLTIAHESLPIVRWFERSGSLRAEWSPRHADGRTFHIPCGITVAPDGQLWTTDGQAIYRLTNDGVVDGVLGNEPRDDRMYEIAEFTVDRHGRLYAVARGTGAVHVHDCEGRRLYIGHPAPTDFDGHVKFAFIEVSDNGIWLAQRPLHNPPLGVEHFTHFSLSGERLDGFDFTPVLDGSNLRWCFLPGTDRRVAIRDQALVILDRTGQTVWQTERRPNGRWFYNIITLTAAPDGSFAVFAIEEAGRDGSREPPEQFVEIYSAEGQPLRTFDLCGIDRSTAIETMCHLAYDGRRVVVVRKSQVVVFDLTDQTFAVANPVQSDERGISYATGRPHLVPGTDNLIFFHRASGTVQLYKLP